MIIGDIATKVEFTNTVRTTVTHLVQMMNLLQMTQVTYNARGYNSGGSDEITDEDIVAAKVTASDLQGVLEPAGLITQLIAVMTNGGCTISDKVRGDM